MALSKQVDIYSIDTAAFYTRKERNIHRKICQVTYEKKRLRESQKFRKRQLHDYGIDDIKNFHKHSFEDFNLEDWEYAQESRYCKEYLYYEELISYKNQLIEKLKSKLIEAMVFREQYHDKHPKLRRVLHPDYLKTQIDGESPVPINVISIFESSLTRMLNLGENKLSDDIIVIRVFYFDIAQDIVKHGFISNGEKYRYLTSSAGQIRQKKMVFIKESQFYKYEKTLMCGLTIDKINEMGGVNVNKFLAYLALSNSATDEWNEFDIDRCIVVEDMETDVSGIYDFIDDADFSITRTNGAVPINHTDGAGMILPCLSDKNFMIRIPWIKGLLAVFDFRKFVERYNGNRIIKDIYGVEHDIIAENIQIIFTKSQFKMYKYYSNWDEYKRLYKLHKCTAGICNMEEDKIPTARINYQMIQSLSDMTTDELKKIAEPSVRKLSNLTSSVKDMLNAFGVTPYNNSKTNVQKALEIYPELLMDRYFKKTLTDIKKSMIIDYKSAKLEIRGKYFFVVPDLFAFCQWLFLGQPNPEGLLKDGEVCCNGYANVHRLDCLRSPSLYREHALRNNLIDDTTREWFTTNAIHISCHDLISRVLQLDCDGDKLLVVADKKIIQIAERNMEGIVPLYYNMRKAAPEILTSESIYNGLKHAFSKSNIGGKSNDITIDWNNPVWYEGTEEEKQDALDVIKYLCLLVNYTIDYAKTLYMPVCPQHIQKLIKKYTKGKVPYFFKYAKHTRYAKYNSEQLKSVIAERNNSVVNRLDGIIKVPRNTYKTLQLAPIDYRLLCSNPDVELNQDLIQKYLRLNNKYHYQVKMHDSDEGNLFYIYHEIKNQLSAFGDDDYVCDNLVMYLYEVKPSSRKEVLWYCYGENIYRNLCNNHVDSNYCMRCGQRINNGRQRYCDDCQDKYLTVKHANRTRYEPMKYKEVLCMDCGTRLIVESKDNHEHRCEDCYMKYRRKYKAEMERNRREKIKNVDSTNRAFLPESADKIGI